MNRKWSADEQTRQGKHSSKAEKTNDILRFCRHGFGRLEFASGMRYNGEWYLDRPQGRGMLIYPDGSILKGHFAGGLSEGSFTYYSSNGYVDLLDFRGGCLIKSRSMQKVDHYSGTNLIKFNVKFSPFWFFTESCLRNYEAHFSVNIFVNWKNNHNHDNLNLKLKLYSCSN